MYRFVRARSGGTAGGVSKDAPHVVAFGIAEGSTSRHWRARGQNDGERGVEIVDDKCAGLVTRSATGPTAQWKRRRCRVFWHKVAASERPGKIQTELEPVASEACGRCLVLEG